MGKIYNVNNCKMIMKTTNAMQLYRSIYYFS